MGPKERLHAACSDRGSFDRDIGRCTCDDGFGEARCTAALPAEGDREMVAAADHLNDYVDDASTAGNNEIHNENHNEQQPPSNQAPTWRVSTT